MVQHTLPVAVFPAKLNSPQESEPLVDQQRRITPGWHRWTVFVDVSVRRMIKLFNFLSLTDTPDSYSGASHKVVRVNAGETALEFAAVAGLPAGGTTGQVLTKIDATDFNADWETPITPVTPISATFVLGSGATGTNVGPELAAIRAGSLTKCLVITKSSDPSTALTLNIKKNGTTIFSSNPSVAGGTSAGTVSDVSANLSGAPVAVAYKDVFTIDVTSGNANWSATIELG
jgi:hypothetical protein